jgi:tetratricopeptide (TPR) repeat protein
MSAPGLKLFVSTVTSEFRSYRDRLQADLKGPLLEVKVQEDFVHLGGDTLSLLDDYISVCDGVIHLIGAATGACPAPVSVQSLLTRYADFGQRVPMVADLLVNPEFSYTQWEAYLALYHGKKLFIYQPSPEAPKDAGFVLDPKQLTLQKEHLERLKLIDRWPGSFLNQGRLSTKVYQSLFNQRWGERVPGSKSKAVIASNIRYDHLKAEKLIGREQELDGLDKAWADEQTRIVIIRAWGGVGKTALVAAWLAEMAAHGWRGAERVFDWTFYLQGARPEAEESKGASADMFLAKALKFFGDPDPQLGSAEDRGARLAQLVSKTKSLLVLDGLEPLQHPPGPMAGKIKDPGVTALLMGLVANNNGLCIVTTREKVDDLKTYYGKTASDWELSHLNEEAGADLLRTLGVIGTETERREASREVKGHALTLQLMGRYLVLAYRGDIRQRDTFKFTEADGETQAGHAFRVLNAYETWLPTSGESGQRQLAILRLLGLFDRPADPVCLAVLRRPPVIPGLTDELENSNDAQWNIAVKRLEEIGLVTPVAHEPKRVFGYSEEIARQALARSSRDLAMDLHEPEEFRPPFSFPLSESLEVHPLLREYFANQLRRDANPAWQAGHRRLFEHLQASTPYWPEGIDGLGPLYQAVAHGCEAGLERQAFADVYRARIMRGTGTGGFYSMHKLGAFGADLGAMACFFTRPWGTPSPNLSGEDQAAVLNGAAFSLRAQGRLTEAVLPYQASLQIRVAMEEWKNAAIVANNLSELELTLGEIAAAVAAGELSVKFGKCSEDQFMLMVSHAAYADALHQAGQRDSALSWFRAAEQLQAKRQPQYPLLYSLWGFQHCDLLLADLERSAWRMTMQRPHLATIGQYVQNEQAGGRLTDTNLKEWQSVFQEVIPRVKQTLQWAKQNQAGSFDFALDNLTLARTRLYAALLDPSSAGRLLVVHGQLLSDSAVKGLRLAGDLTRVPLGLLTRACLRWLNSDEAGCRADLDEACQIAERGPMRLHMADVLLTRARLFRDLQALAEARKLIEQCGYGRRMEELANAEVALVVT